MNEYYGDLPYSESLAHWGVKGMKWGIRKARPVGSGVSKSFGYKRAEKKLARLQAKANSAELIKRANRLDKVSKGARVVGRVGLGAAAAGTAGTMVSRHVLDPNTISWANKLHDTIRRTSDSMSKTMGQSGGSTLQEIRDFNAKHHSDIDSEYANRMNKISNLNQISRGVQAGGAGLAALGYGTAIGSKLRANVLRKRAGNAQKMAKARKKASDFQKQMALKYGTQSIKRRK